MFVSISFEIVAPVRQISYYFLNVGAVSLVRTDIFCALV